jgi:hypothetical protein
MKRRIYLFAMIAIYNISMFAQSVYMHEAQDDAREVGDGISGILGILTVIGIGLFIVIFVPLMVGEKISDAKFSKKYDRRRDLLQNEALAILSQLALSNKDFIQIKDNPKWKNWYLKGYRDGVDNGETEFVKNYETQTYDRVPWEVYSEKTFSQLASSDIYIKFECGGDVRLSKLAYDEGRKHGVCRNKEKGDAREMLN